MVGITGLLLVGALALVLTHFDDERLKSTRLQLALGIIPGLLAVLVVAVPRYDLVPDSLKLPMQVVLIGIALLAAGTQLLILYLRRRR